MIFKLTSNQYTIWISVKWSQLWESSRKDLWSRGCENKGWNIFLTKMSALKIFYSIAILGCPLPERFHRDQGKKEPNLTIQCRKLRFRSQEKSPRLGPCCCSARQVMLKKIREFGNEFKICEHLTQKSHTFTLKSGEPFFL